MRHKLFVGAVALGVLLLTARATADPIRWQDDVTVTTKSGQTRILPPGYYLSSDDWGKLNKEVRRLQQQEIRLSAENKVLRSWPRSAWVVAAMGFVAGATVILVTR